MNMLGAFYWTLMYQKSDPFLFRRITLWLPVTQKKFPVRISHKLFFNLCDPCVSTWNLRLCSSARYSSLARCNSLFSLCNILTCFSSSSTRSSRRSRHRWAASLFLFRLALRRANSSGLNRLSERRGGTPHFSVNQSWIINLNSSQSRNSISNGD